MDTKKEDTDVKTAPEAPAMPAPGEPGPGPSAVPSEPLHGPVDVAEDSLEGLVTAVAHQSQTPDPTTSSDLIYTYNSFHAYFLPSPQGSTRT